MWTINSKKYDFTNNRSFAPGRRPDSFLEGLRKAIEIGKTYYLILDHPSKNLEPRDLKTYNYLSNLTKQNIVFSSSSLHFNKSFLAKIIYSGSEEDIYNKAFESLEWEGFSDSEDFCTGEYYTDYIFSYFKFEYSIKKYNDDLYKVLDKCIDIKDLAKLLYSFSCLRTSEDKSRC